MFIIDGVYRNVDISGLSAPILEGTVLTETGAIASADGSDAFGIVPQNIYEIPPTKLASVVVGGTIDLRSPANANVEFSEAVMKALGADINFVQNSEAAGGGGGGGALPPFTDSDAEKVLKIVTPVETVTVLPLQSVTTDAAGTAALSEVDFSRLTDGDTVIFEVDGDGHMSISATYRSTPTAGLYYENNLIVDSTTLYTAPLGAPGSAEIDVSSYAEIPMTAVANWSNQTVTFIVRLHNGHTDKTYSQIESALRSGRPCTLIVDTDDVISGTGIIYNAEYDPSIEGQYKYIVLYIAHTSFETMQCENPNDTLFIL